jgi:hypothetical protein
MTARLSHPTRGDFSNSASRRLPQSHPPNRTLPQFGRAAVRRPGIRITPTPCLKPDNASAARSLDQGAAQLLIEARFRYSCIRRYRLLSGDFGRPVPACLFKRPRSPLPTCRRKNFPGRQQKSRPPRGRCATLLHGSVAGRSRPPAFAFMRDEGTLAALARACGLARRQQWPPRSSFGP